MPKFELGFAFRGTAAPEVKQVVEADSMREAMLRLIDEHGGPAAVLVTYAHPYHSPEPLQPRYGYGLDVPGVASFMLGANDETGLITEQRFREQHGPPVLEERPRGLTVVRLGPMPEAVTATETAEQAKDDESSGVLCRLPAATD